MVLPPEALPPRISAAAAAAALGLAILAGLLLLAPAARGGRRSRAAAPASDGGGRSASSGPSAAAEEEEEDEATSGGAAAAADGAGKKKKRRKKKKSKANKGGGAPPPPDAPDETEPAPQPEAEPEAEPEEAAAGGAGRRRKKKKKKEKAGDANGNAGGGSAEPEPKEAADGGGGGENDAPAKARGAASASASAASGRRAAAAAADPDGGGWVVEKPKKKKKGGDGQRRAQKKSTPTSSSGEVRESVTIEARKVGIIIGPKGATMKSVEAATDTKLEVNAPQRDDDAKSARSAANATVVITGTADNVGRARAAIRELCDKGYTTATQGEGFAEHYVAVHPRVLPELVGPGGSTIRALQDGLGVRVTIPPTDWRPGVVPQAAKVKPARVGVVGQREACVRAKAAIQFISRYHHHEITHPGLVHEEVDVPPEFLHCVIGPRGSEIRHIKGNFGCDVHVPNDDSYSPNVIVVGRRVMVDRAVSHIMNLMDRDSEMRERRYDDNYY